MNLLYLLLGSNTGNSRFILQTAIQHIQVQVGKVISQSSLYETEPWGNKDQPVFINQILLVETSLNAEDVLQKTLQIEKMQGRERIAKWSPRTLDIDIIYYNHDIIVTSHLKIPHPELHNRNFTLIPLVEISPDFIHPVFNVSNEVLLQRSPDVLRVKRLSTSEQ